jgi:hypothetical protein
MLLFILCGTLATEAAPLVLGTGARATFDWSFPYVTMKFVLLPGASLLVLGGLLVQVAKRAAVPWPAWAAGLVALLYLVALALWPVAWFA